MSHFTSPSIVMKKIFYVLFLLFLAGGMASAKTINIDAAAVRDLPKLCDSGTPEQVAEALGKVGDVNSVTVDDGMPMLFVAAANNPNPKVVELLIQAGANLKATATKHGHTALIIASMHNSPEIVSVLLKAGCNVNEVSKIGNTPLMVALRDNPNLNVARTLIAAGANVNAKNNNQRSVIMTVAEGDIAGGALQALDILLKAGVDINDKDKDGLTPLMILSNLNPDIPLLTAFLQNGANAKATDNSGKTALDYVKNEYVGTDGYKILDAAVNGQINISNLPPPSITPPVVATPPIVPSAPPITTPPVVATPPTVPSAHPITTPPVVATQPIVPSEPLITTPPVVATSPTVTPAPPVITPPVAVQPPTPVRKKITPPVVATPPIVPPAPPIITPPVAVPQPTPVQKTFSLEGTWVTIFNNQYMYMKVQGNQYQAWMNGANVLTENGYFQLQNNVISGINQISGNSFAFNVRFSDDGMYVQLTDANGNGFQYQKVQ